MQPRLTLTSTLLCAWLAGCGGAPDAARGPSLVHLDPLAAGGLPARDALAAGEVTSARWTINGDRTLRAPWTYAGPTPRPHPAGGLSFPGGLDQAQQRATLSIAWEPGAAPPFDTLRLVTDFEGACTAGVRIGYADGSSLELPVPVPYSADRQSLDLDLAGRLRPDGVPVSLDLAPALDAVRELRLSELALVHKGLAAPSAAPQAGDAGLHQLAGALRRVWPSSDGQALELRLEVPPRARFEVQLYPGPGGERLVAAGGSFAPELEVRSSADAAWRPLSWHAGAGELITVDLAELAGQTVELRLTAKASRPLPPPEVLALWHEPVLVRARNPSTPPNIVLVTLDTTRADMAADPLVAPTLARLADEGLAFDQAWSPSNTTTPSHASLFTGLLPHDHGAVAVGRRLHAPKGTTLAERLRAVGYRTAAAVSVEHLDAAHGFAAGFDRFLDATPAMGRDGRFALRFAEDYLSEVEARSAEPFFLWVHWFDPHMPYVLPEDVDQPRVLLEDEPQGAPIPDGIRDRQRIAWLPPDEDLAHLRGRYRAGVAFTDAMLASLVAELERTGLWQDTILAVTADHGECLGEADIHASHTGLFEPTLRVPLVLRLPWDEALDPAAKGLPVSSMDLFPTLLELAGAEVPSLADARSLLAPEPGRVLWLEGDRLGQVARFDGRHQLIATLRRTSLGFVTELEYAEPGRTELFDLSDPEVELLATDQAPPEAEAWQAELRAFLEQRLDPDGLEHLLSPEERETLLKLGYLGDE
ncbi:MAG: sulfatase [Planctomycetota bacterium]|nr:sulfatase [Planctomycetota bacterium]